MKQEGTARHRTFITRSPAVVWASDDLPSGEHTTERLPASPKWAAYCLDAWEGWGGDGGSDKREKVDERRGVEMW